MITYASLHRVFIRDRQWHIAMFIALSFY